MKSYIRLTLDNLLRLPPHGVCVTPFGSLYHEVQQAVEVDTNHGHNITIDSTIHKGWRLGPTLGSIYFCLPPCVNHTNAVMLTFTDVF